MRFQIDTVQQAFECFGRVYPRWQIQDKLAMYEAAERAFADKGHVGDFETVYDGLRRWQVFRKGGPRIQSRTLFDQLKAIDGPYKRRRLSDLTSSDVMGLFRVLKSVATIKRTKKGPSIMAISKFLHFWNPRLFVIVDHEMMESWVFEHDWIKKALEAERHTLQGIVSPEAKNDTDYQYPFAFYMTVLMWCGSLIRTNPSIIKAFEHFIALDVADSSLVGDCASYEALAVECFLLGVVDLPPQLSRR